MKKPTSKRESDLILRFKPDLESLKRFVQCLNTKSFSIPVPGEGGWRIIQGDSTPVKQELGRLVQAWFDSGPNVSKLWSEHPDIAGLSHMARAYMLPTQGCRALLIYAGGPQTDLSPGDPLEIALGLFFLFLLNPYNEKLGGPCKHCGKYYVKKTKRQTVYCSKRCGLRYTSLHVNRRRRVSEHLEHLELAKLATSEWTKTKAKVPWKEWVSKYTLLSKKWLTLAVKNGELPAPVKLIQEKGSSRG